MFLAPRRTPSTSSSTFFPLFQVSNGCSHQEIPVTDIVIQNLSQNKLEEMANVHIIDHRANTAENFAMRRRTAGTPRKINLRLALARAGLMTETKARTNDNQAQQYEGSVHVCICCCDKSDTYEHLLASMAEMEEPEKEVRSLFLPCAQWSACATMAGVQQISAMEIIGTNED